MVILAAIAIALTTPAPEIAITHVSVVDVEKASIKRDLTVLLSRTTIKAIGKHVRTNNANVVDGTGKFLIPGLWDMHVHCCNADDHFFPLFVANGVTGIRDMADPLDELKVCRSNIQSGAVLGPTIVFSGQIVDGPKPIHPDASIAVGTPEEARKAVDALQSNGADFIKVYSFLPRDAYFAIAAETKKRGLAFAGHVPDAISAEEASDAGQKSFEHLISVLEGCSTMEAAMLADPGYILRPRHIQEMVGSYSEAKAQALFTRFRRNGTWQCPTLTAMNIVLKVRSRDFTNDPRFACLPEDIASFWNPKAAAGTNTPNAQELESGRFLFAWFCTVVGKMQRSGVGILAGTDTPNAGAFPGFGIHDELALLVKSGLTPAQALQAATVNPARYFGWEKRMGTIEVGKVANLVLLDANPLEDIRNTTKIEAVFLRGQYLNRSDLDRMLKTRASF